MIQGGGSMDINEYIFIGIDLHKKTHTAVIVDHLGHKLDRITFNNVTKGFEDLEKKVDICLRKAEKAALCKLSPFFCLENPGEYGRALTAMLLGRGYIVKDINPALSNRQAKHRAMYRKSDEDDALAIAYVGIREFDHLPQAYPADVYWSVKQLIHRRDNLSKYRVRLINQLHEQLHNSFPYYDKFFKDISRPTALFFFKTFPSRESLSGLSAEDIGQSFRAAGMRSCPLKKCEFILDTVNSDKTLYYDHQASADLVTRTLISDITHTVDTISEIDAELENLYRELNLTLTTIPGVNTIMAMKLIAEIGNIERFRSSERLAKYAGIAPMPYGSAGKNRDCAAKQGNRKLQAAFYYLAIQQIQISVNKVPRNPYFRSFYEKKLQEGKRPKQALICIARKLVKIVYSMLKKHSTYTLLATHENDET